MYNKDMAAPTTHIVLTEKVFEKNFSKKDKKEFYVGTSFPDIRYLGVIDRNKTHFNETNMEDVLKSDSFLAGMKFHSLVDRVREDFMNDKNLYSLFPESPFLIQAVKVFEDKVLYPKVLDWKKVIHFFDDIDRNELGLGIEEKDILRWHHLLRHYFSQPIDNDAIIKMFNADLGRPREMVDGIISVLKNVSDKDKATKIVEDFYENFEKLISE